MKTGLVIIFILGVAASFFLRGSIFPGRGTETAPSVLSPQQISSRVTIPETVRRLTQPQTGVVRPEARQGATLPSEGAVGVENIPGPIFSLLPLPILQRPTSPTTPDARRTPVSRPGVSFLAPPPISPLDVPVSSAPTSVSFFSAFLSSLPPELGPLRPYVPSVPRPAFSLPPELALMRASMIASGTILSTEFSEIRNNADIEAFLLKMIEWKGKELGASAEDIAASQSRIRAAYNSLK